jgi:hypothetical protein
MKRIIITLLCFLFVVPSFTKQRLYIIIPSSIKIIGNGGFYNEGRLWSFDSRLSPEVKNGVLYLSYRSQSGHQMIFTAPGEYKNEKNIYTSGYSKLIVAFDKTYQYKTMITFEIILQIGNKLQVYEYTKNCYGKSYVEVPIKNSYLINNLNLSFHGESGDISIKAIYLR